MPRGPAPTPTKILKARGSWRAKLRKDEPTPPVEAPECPAFLSKPAKEEWRRVVEQLLRLGILAEVDRALLAGYCEAWGEFQELVKRIRKLGYVRAHLKGLVSLKNRAFERMNKAAQQFGFSPSSRTRIKVENQGKKETDAGKARFFRAG